MEGLILKLITMSLQASVAIGAVVLVRYIFGLLKIPKKYAYLLWIIPFIRLCMPFAIESQLSIMPESFSFMEKVAEENGDVKTIDNNDINGNGYTNDYELQYYHNANDSDDVQYSDEYYQEYNYILESNGLSGEVDYSEATDNQSYNGNDSTTIISYDTHPEYTPNSSNAYNLESKKNTSTYPSWTKLACIIWYIGVAGFIIYSYIAYIRLKKRLEAKVLLKSNVYLSDNIDTGFVIGAFKPYICIPSDLDEDKQEYVIAHESYHIKRRDYIAKTIYFIVTVVHWFNPFVWLAYFMMERDMEMSCDEAVLYQLGMDSKKDYATTLLHMATDRRNPISMPIAFGEGSTKGRIKNIMKFKKPVVIAVIVAILGIIVLAVLLLTNPGNKDKDARDDKLDGVATEMDADMATSTNGKLNTSTDSDSNLNSDDSNSDTNQVDDEDIKLKPGRYVYVPEGDTLDGALNYAPYVVINTFTNDITVASTSWTYLLHYGKYHRLDNQLSTWVGGDMNFYFTIEDGKLIYKSDSFEIKYVKPDGDVVYTVTTGGEFIFMPGSDFDMANLYDGYSHETFDKEYETAIEVDIINPDLTDIEGIGADVPMLDFADMKFVIFHDYRGLYVYDRIAGGIRGAVNLESIGMNYTQGDNTCFVSVGNNGYRVYLKTMSSDIAYVYDVQYNQLFQVNKAYVESQESSTPSLVTDELFGDDFTTWQSYNCMEVYDGNTTYYGYLTSGSGLWEDMTFVERSKDTDAVRRFNLVRDYKDMLEGTERDARLETIKGVRATEIEVEKIENKLSDSDYTLYDDILEMHRIAKEQSWDRDTMEENGLASGSNGGVYSGYAYLDITGDGVDELIFGYTSENASIILAAYSIKDNKVNIILSGHERSYYNLCEDSVIKHHWSNSASNSGTQHFYIGADGLITYLEGIVLDGKYSGKHLWYYSTEYGKCYSYECKPVTHEYAMDILYGYSTVNIDFTYLEAPEASQMIPYFSPEEDEAKNAFGSVLENWSDYPEVEEVMSGFCSAYCGYYDIDSDGVVELIINNEKCMGIFKYENGEIKRIYCGPYSGLLEDGTAMYYRPGGAPENKVYKYYVYDGEEYVEKDDFTWYNNDEGGNYSPSEDDNYFYNGELISQDEWNKLKAPYDELEFAKKQNMFVIYSE